MAEFTLKPREADTLQLHIGDETFHIPLGGCLTPEEAAPLDTQAGTIAFFQKYLSEDLKKVLTINDYNEITKAWIKESQRASKKKPGES